MAPKARRDRLKVRDIGPRVALLDERDGRVHVLDPVATAIWRLADGRASVDELSELVAAALRAGVPSEALSPEAFARGLHDLEAAGLLNDTEALSRRSVLAAAVLAPTVLTIGSAVAAGPAAAAASVAICHRGKTIMVSPSAVADHLAHGDTLGACGATTTVPPTTTSTTPTFTTTTSTTPTFTTTTSTTSTTPTFTTTTSTTSTTPTFTTTTSTTSTTPTFTTTTSTTQAPEPTTTSTTPAPTTALAFA